MQQLLKHILSNSAGAQARHRALLVIVIGFALSQALFFKDFSALGVLLGIMRQSEAPLCAWRRIDVAHAGVEKCTL
jgi:hypothetical protein